MKIVQGVALSVLAITKILLPVGGDMDGGSSVWKSSSSKPPWKPPSRVEALVVAMRLRGGLDDRGEIEWREEGRIGGGARLDWRDMRGRRGDQRGVDWAVERCAERGIGSGTRREVEGEGHRRTEGRMPSPGSRRHSSQIEGGGGVAGAEWGRRTSHAHQPGRKRQGGPPPLARSSAASSAAAGGGGAGGAARFKLHVKGLPRNVTSRCLGNLMRQTFDGARVRDSYVPTDPSSKHSSQSGSQVLNKGFGFVTFEDPRMVDVVVGRGGGRMQGWGVELSVARASPRGEGRDLQRGEAQEANRRSEGLQELQVLCPPFLTRSFPSPQPPAPFPLSAPRHQR